MLPPPWETCFLPSIAPGNVRRLNPGSDFDVIAEVRRPNSGILISVDANAAKELYVAHKETA
jgi:hypothetical protein